MADNTTLNSGADGDVIRNVDKNQIKTQVVIVDHGGSGSEDIAARPHGAGNVTAQTPRVVLASDQAPVTINKAAVTNVTSTALEASHVLKASAGSLVSLMVTNTKASAQWILVMNSTTVPGDGAVTLLIPPVAIGAGETIKLDWDTPKVASTGIAVCNSSTGTFTKTIGSADCVFDAQVI